MQKAKILDQSEQSIFIFSTRGAPVLGKYHEPLKKMLVEKDLKKAAKFLGNRFLENCMPDLYGKVELKLPVRDGFVNTYNLKLGEIPVVLKGDIVTINQSACLGCGKCVKVCPLGVMGLNDKKAFPLKELDCTLCSLCEINCRERAIKLHYSWLHAIKVAIRHGKRTSL